MDGYLRSPVCEEMIFVSAARLVGLRAVVAILKPVRGSVRVPQVDDVVAQALLLRPCDEAPGIVDVVKIDKGVLIAAAEWGAVQAGERASARWLEGREPPHSLLGRRHATIPFAIHCRTVAASLHVFGDPCHVAWDPCPPGVVVRDIAQVWAAVDCVNMDRIAPALHCRAGGRAELENIVTVKLDAFLHERRHVGRLDVHVVRRPMPSGVTSRQT